MFIQLKRQIRIACILLPCILASAIATGCAAGQRPDASQSNPQEEFHYFQIRNRNAAEVAKMLDDLFNRQPSAPRSAADGWGLRSRHHMRVVADGKANRLLVLADPEALRIIQEILNNTESYEGLEPPDLSMYRLKHAKAGPAAALLMSLFKFDGFPVAPESKLEAVHDPWYFNAVAYEATNHVVIAASHSVLHKATAVLEELDRSSDPEYHPETQPTQPPTTIKFDLQRADQ